MTAPCNITRWRNLLDPNGESHALGSWDALFREFGTVDGFRGTNEHPGWSPAEFEPCKRAKEHVTRVHAVCLDYDGGTSIDEAVDAWAGHYGYLHTTRRHSDDAPRFRVILPLSRSVSPFEFGALWRRIGAKHGGLDPAPKDPSRFWFWPSCNDEGEYHDQILDGDPLDPDVWLATPDPAQDRRPQNIAPPSNDVERRALAYIERMPPAISGAGGHQATWNVALVLAKGFGLSEGDTLRILRDHYSPRCEPPWAEKELEHKARDAKASERVAEGFLLDDDRGWDRRGFSLPTLPTDPQEPEETPKSAAERYGFVSMPDLMREVVEQLAKGERGQGVSAGSDELDIAIGGFRRGNVTVFGAKRGFGKSSYGNMVATLAMPHANVALFAGEDSQVMYGKRLLAAKAGINAMLLRDNKIQEGDMERIERAMREAPPNPFFVRVNGRPVEWIAKAIRDLAKEAPIDLVVVDYLQCLKTSTRTQDRRTEITHICKTLSDAIKEVDASGLIFSQLKRTERQVPEVEDLKESGDIEDMADHILLGWKEETDRRAERLIKVGKNKDGVDASEIDHVTMRWNRKTAAFEYTPSGGGGETSPQYDEEVPW